MHQLAGPLRSRIARIAMSQIWRPEVYKDKGVLVDVVDVVDVVDTADNRTSVASLKLRIELTWGKQFVGHKAPEPLIETAEISSAGW